MVHRGPQRGGEWGALWGDLRHMGRVRIDGFSDRFQDRRSREEEARDGDRSGEGEGEGDGGVCRGRDFIDCRWGRSEAAFEGRVLSFLVSYALGRPGCGGTSCFGVLWTGWWKQR